MRSRRVVTFLIVSLILSSYLFIPSSSSLLKLTDQSFEETIHSDVYAIVLFHGSNRRDEKALDVFETISKSVDPTKVVVATMDLRTERVQAKRFGITGFPVVLFFYKDGTLAVPSISLDDAGALLEFIQEETGYRFKLKTSNTKLSLRLTASSFESAVLDKNKFVLVCFCADSRICTEFEESQYDQVTKTFRSDSDVLIASFDVSDSHTIARNCGVQLSSKTRVALRWFPIGHDKAARHYEGELRSDAIVSFVNLERTNSTRMLGGMLSTNAGRNENADRLARDIIRALNRGYNENDLIMTTIKPFPLYHQIATKILRLGVKYVDTEIKRLDSLLSQADSFSARKRDFISMRRNVLNAFVDVEDGEL